MASIEWSDVDFGLDNTDASNVRSFARAIPGNVNMARAFFAFPGVDGIFSRNMGFRGQTVRVAFQTLVKSEAAWNDLEDDILASMEGSHQLIVEGRTRTRCILVEYTGRGAPRMPLLNPGEVVGTYKPFLFAVEFTMTFLDLTAGG